MVAVPGMAGARDKPCPDYCRLPPGTLALPALTLGPHPAAAGGPILKKKRDFGQRVAGSPFPWRECARPGEHWPVSEEHLEPDIHPLL